MTYPTILTATCLASATMLSAFLAVPVISGAQYVEHWRIEGPGKVIAGGAYFDNEAASGMAYNPVTDNILVAVSYLHTVPNAGQLMVIDPENGDFKGWVPTDGVSGGVLGKKVTTVDRGSGDYSVYVSAAIDDAKGTVSPGAFYRGAFKLWRWTGANSAEETTLGPSVRIYENYTIDVADPSWLPPEHQIGPPLPATELDTVGVGRNVHAVYNSGANETTVYLEVSGAPALAQTPIFALKIDESTGAVTAADAIYLDHPMNGKSHGFTRDSAGNIYRYLDSILGQITPEGTFIAPNDVTILPSGAQQLRYMEWNGRGFLGGILRDSASSSGHSVLRVAEITQGIERATLHSVTGHATMPSWTGSRGGDIALDTRRGRFIGLITDNMLLSFSQVEVPLLVTLAEFGATVNEPGGTVTVQWETAAEIDNVGFNVYRTSANNASAETRVNATLIPAAGSAGQGAAYSLVDAQAMAPGESRSYVLEDVDANGKQTRHAPATITRDTSNSAVGEWMLY